MKKSLLAGLLLIGLSPPAWADTRYELRVDGLACPFCAYGIEKKLKALEGVIDESMEIKLNEGVVVFHVEDDTLISEDSLKRLVNDAGFSLRGVKTHKIQTSK